MVDIKSPPEIVDSGAQHNGTETDAQRRKGKNRNKKNTNGMFAGSINELRGAVYDVTTGQDTFTTTTRKIAEYVSREYANASEYRTAMINMELPRLTPPAPPDNTENIAAFELWKIELRQYSDRIRDRENSAGRVFATVMGQCSQTLRNRMEADSEWGNINNSNDVIRLLRLIRNCMTQGQTRQFDVHTLVSADIRILTFRQDRYMSDNVYFERFKEYLADAERLGSTIGATVTRVQNYLNNLANDPENPTTTEYDQAVSKAKESYFSVLFLLNSDPRRYGSLVRDIQNEFTRGMETYPDTLTTAYDYLVNYKRGPHFNQGNTDKEHNEMAYHQQELTQVAGNSKGGKQHGGNNNKNNRKLNGPSGQRGRSDKPGSGSEENDDAQFLLDNTNSTSDDIISYTSGVVFQLGSATQKDLLKNQLLLDSCSTICLISNPLLLHNIHLVSKTMKVQCNAGVRSTNQMGWLGGFPEPVWYDPGGIANILSLNVVQQYYRVKYDSAEGNAIHVYTKGKTLLFTPQGKGLYGLSNEDIPHDWTFVTTVKDKAAGYTKRQCSQAKLARKLQNIAMFPCSNTIRNAIDHNVIQNMPITRQDVAIADDIFGLNPGSLQGKTVRRKGIAVEANIKAIPEGIKERIGIITLAADIMFVNEIPMLITISRHLQFGTVESIDNKQSRTISKALNNTIQLYRKRGLNVGTILGDNDFAPLTNDFPDIQFNICSANEHVPEIERYIRTVKDRVRSCYNSLPFRHVPKLVIKRMVSNAVFWLNAFPKPNGVSDTISPRYIILGVHLDASKHMRLEFGDYVQTHELSRNDMHPRTTGAICLGPNGNEQGGHYFMSLLTGKRLIRHQWTSLPMPADAIERVNKLGKGQDMRRTLTFGNRIGHEYDDDPDSIDDDHDSDYEPSDHDSKSDELSTGSYDSEEGDNYSYQHEAQGNDDLEHDGIPNNQVDDNISVDVSTGSNETDDEHNETIPNHDDDGVVSIREEEATITGVEDLVPAVDNIDHDEVNEGNPEEGEDEEISGEIEEQDNDSNSVATTEEMDAKYGARNHKYNLRPRKKPSFHHLHAHIGSLEKLIDYDDCPYHMFLTEQMSLKRGLKVFGKSGADAVVKELRQIDRMGTIIPVKAHELTKTQRHSALRYLMYLKEKRSGKIKARGCADGRPQRVYKSKHDVSSPTVTTESIFITSLIDAHEKRKVITVDVPGAFMHANIDEEIFIKLNGPMAELLARVDKNKYAPCIEYEQGKPVVYAKLAKALYGTLQAAYLFWKNLTSFLVDDLGFELNPYDQCVANKMIDGKQCTICWHVDDLKISHVDEGVLNNILQKLEDKYGSADAPLTATHGTRHDYLGMSIDFSTMGKVSFYMNEYVDNLMEELPSEFDGEAVTPAADYLFTVNSQAQKLNSEQADFFHRMTAKLLYLCKRVRIDIQVAVAFLTTRVKSPNVDDWKKLRRVMCYLRKYPYLGLTLEASSCNNMHWWIDASFGVHHDKRSHTGITMSMGRGAVISSSLRQRINTKSSTEAELVGVDDGMPLICWTRNFLKSQGVDIARNVVYQDNQSAILLERNGNKSSGRRTRHIDIRYFFVTDRIKKGELQVEYCPTDDMYGDFFTKPLQGSKFRRMRGALMNLPDGYNNEPSGSSQECVGNSVFNEPALNSPKTFHDWDNNEWKVVTRIRTRKQATKQQTPSV